MTGRSHNHPRDVNTLEGLQQEVREARRSIDGAKGRKARKLANRDKQRTQHGKAFDGHRAADQEGRTRPQD